LSVSDLALGTDEPTLDQLEDFRHPCRVIRKTRTCKGSFGAGTQLADLKCFPFREQHGMGELHNISRVMLMGTHLAPFDC
jgi:hypothetical protein